MGLPFRPDRRRAATVAVVLLIAFLTGHIMQTVLADRDPVVRMEKAPDAAPELRRRNVPRPLPVPPAATLVPISAPPVLPVIETDPRPSHDGCTPSLIVSPVPRAAVDVIVTAPCRPGHVVTLTDGALRLDGRLDAHGMYKVRMPALAEEVRLAAEIDELRFSARTRVRDAAGFRHTALAWSGPQGMRIRRLGSDTPGVDDDVRRLGEGMGFAVEVYTARVTLKPRGGGVRLVVEAEVTPEVCGRSIEATTIQSNATGRLSRKDFAIEMPACRHVGQTIRLKILFEDMTVAGH